MGKKVTQYRYYKPDHPNNFPKSPAIRSRNLVSGSIFFENTPIIQLGIQALPGTKFYLNGSNFPVIIGNTGIYELDLQGQGEINEIRFDSNSIHLIEQNENAYLIVDIIYEEEEEI